MINKLKMRNQKRMMMRTKKVVRKRRWVRVSKMERRRWNKARRRWPRVRILSRVVCSDLDKWRGGLRCYEVLTSLRSISRSLDGI